MRYAIVLTLALLSYGCGRENADYAQSGPSESTTNADSVAPVNATSGTMQADRDEPGSRVEPAPPTQEVHLIEYAIHVPDSIQGGRVAFSIENGGKEDHGFEIEGGQVHASTRVLKRGDSESLTVDLPPGKYTVYCPLHKDRMTKTLTVN